MSEAEFFIKGSCVNYLLEVEDSPWYLETEDWNFDEDGVGEMCEHLIIPSLKSGKFVCTREEIDLGE